MKFFFSILLFLLVLLQSCSPNQDSPDVIDIYSPRPDLNRSDLSTLTQKGGLLSLAFPQGSLFKAVQDGTVVQRESASIIIEHRLERGYYYSIYYQMTPISVDKGEKISHRTVLGRTKGDELHFSIFHATGMKRIRNFSKVDNYPHVSAEKLHGLDTLPSLAIINPCKKANKLSMVKPVAAILREETEIEPDVLHFLDLDKENLSEFDGIIITGQSTPWEEYDLTDFAAIKEVIDDGTVPVLGICGGHQLICLLYGGTVDLIKEESCPKEGNYAGCFKVKGYVGVTLKEEEPLFSGFKEKESFFASHCEEIKTLPDNFITIGATSFSPVYAFKMKKRPVFGLQFHPELPANNNSSTRAVITNFIRYYVY